MLKRTPVFFRSISIVLMAYAIDATSKDLMLDMSLPGMESKIVLYSNQGVINQSIPMEIKTGNHNLVLRPDYSAWRTESLEIYAGSTAVKIISWQQPLINKEQIFEHLLGREIEVFRHDSDGSSRGKLVHLQSGYGFLTIEEDQQEIFSLNTVAYVRDTTKKRLSKEVFSPLMMGDFNLKNSVNSVSLSYINQRLSFKTYYHLIMGDKKIKMKLNHHAILINDSNSNYMGASVLLASGDDNSRQATSPMLRSSLSRDFMPSDVTNDRRGELNFISLPLKYDLKPKGRINTQVATFDNIGGNIYYNYKFTGQAHTGTNTIIDQPYQVINFTAPADLPFGEVLVFQHDRNDNLLLLGESYLKQSAQGSTVLLGQGSAYLIEIERIRVNVKTQVNQDVVSWQLIVKNRKKEAIHLKIVDEDKEFVKVDQIKGATLSKSGNIQVDIPADTSKKIYFSSVYHKR